MASDENIAKMKRIMLHAAQVQEGLIPADSPDDFVKPEGDDALDERGLPWWFGPDYHPTPEALAEFAKPTIEAEGAESEQQAGFDLGDPL